MPVFILQILFSVLQVAWMLHIPGHGLLLAVAIGISMVGMGYERIEQRAGRSTALIGGTLSVVIWAFYPNPVSTLGLIALALLALWQYRRWELLLALYGPLIALALLVGLGAHWRLLLVAGGTQTAIGAALVIATRPRSFRTFSQTFVTGQDWASPFLWIGALSVTAGVIQGWAYPADLIPLMLVLAGTAALLTVWLRIPRLPYVPLLLCGMAGFLHLDQLARMSFSHIQSTLVIYGVSMAAAALAVHVFSLGAVAQPRPFPRMRWLVWWVRPLLRAGSFLAILSAALVPVTLLYGPKPVWFAANFLLFSLIALVIYRKTDRRLWIVLALGSGWLAWQQMLAALNLIGLQWNTIPFGILLLALARMTDRLDPRLSEILAVGLLALGSAADLVRSGPLSLAAVGLAVELIGLAVYGYGQRRAVPFISVVLIVTGGVLYAIFCINPWLIPLAAGLLLLVGAVLLEVYHERVRQWLVFWFERLDLVNSRPARTP
jgi:hypothetical protein